MPDKPNIVVFWGDDIGISNLELLQRRPDGLPDAQHRPARKRGRCASPTRTASRAVPPGASAFITGQSAYRTGLSKVGLPGRRVRSAARRTRRSPSSSSRSATRRASSARTTSATATSTCRPMHGFDEFFGNLYHLNAEEEPEHPDYPNPQDVPELSGAVRPRGVLHSQDDAATGKHSAIKDTGPLTKKRMETIDDEIVDGAIDFIERKHNAANAVLRVDQHDAHALPNAPEAPERGSGGTLAVPLPRHDGRPRQARGQGPRQARPARHHRGHNRRVLDRQRRRT